MAHRRSFRGRGISESQRRKKAWIGLKQSTGASGGGLAIFQTSLGTFTSATAAASGATAKNSVIFVSDPTTDLGDEVSTLPEECTILRARGSLLFPKNEITASSTNTAANYAFGFGVTDIRTLVNGTQPGPILDVDWDGWMFLRQSAVAPVDSVGTVVDVKAMRKIKTGDAFFVSVESVAGTAAGAAIGDFQFDLRLLILLP